ncbi:fructosamine kinase family protein [Actinobaculum sp. 352]|uniref:fructosamine kinase family protein n=1 Tax=Actinobaculum sp. 352 TaxID=2490946 RepID=UPI001F49E23F|nr:fructosamine kinase family protein [Actinobaculum sp. 352]
MIPLSTASTFGTGTFTKRGTAVAIAAEAAGLRELAAAARAGGAPVVRLMGSSTTSLQTARLSAAPPSPRAAETFGRLLAVTHAFCPDGQRVFGQAPTGVHDDGVMGEAPLPLVFTAGPEHDSAAAATQSKSEATEPTKRTVPHASPEPDRAGTSPHNSPEPDRAGTSPHNSPEPDRAGTSPHNSPEPDRAGTSPAGWERLPFPAHPKRAIASPALPRRTWGEFYADDRLLPYLPAARANGSITAQGAAVIEKLAARLHSGMFDAPQPALVHTDAALLHGDLWSGNVFWASADSASRGAVTPSIRDTHPTAGTDPVAVLIDPASHGGHAESDLAQLTVFGAPFVERVYAAYHETSPLADGWRERIGLHRLHILIVHAALFGGTYGVQTVEEARGYL